MLSISPVKSLWNANAIQMKSNAALQQKHWGGNWWCSQNNFVLQPEGNIFWKWNSTQNPSLEYQTSILAGLKDSSKQAAVCAFAKGLCYNQSPETCLTVAPCCGLSSRVWCQFARQWWHQTWQPNPHVCSLILVKTSVLPGSAEVKWKPNWSPYIFQAMLQT